MVVVEVVVVVLVVEVVVVEEMEVVVREVVEVVVREVEEMGTVEVVSAGQPFCPPRPFPVCYRPLSCPSIYTCKCVSESV